MLRTTALTGVWIIDIWEDAQGHCASQDESFCQERPDCLRVGVLDGVTPTVKTPRHAGVDGAIWAASVARTAFKYEAGLEECADAANLELLEEVESYHRPQAM